MREVVEMILQAQGKWDPFVAHYSEMNAKVRTSCDESSVLGRLLAPCIVFAAAPGVRAQPNGVQHANDFTSTEYFEPPHQQQIKSILSGAEALPQPGGLLIIKQLKLEMFSLDGKPEGGECAGMHL